MAETDVPLPMPNGIHPLAHSPTPYTPVAGYTVGNEMGSLIGASVVIVPALVDSVHELRLRRSPSVVPGGRLRTQVSTKIAYTSPPVMVPLAVRFAYGARTRTPMGTVVVRGGSDAGGGGDAGEALGAAAEVARGDVRGEVPGAVAVEVVDGGPARLVRGLTALRGVARGVAGGLELVGFAADVTALETSGDGATLVAGGAPTWVRGVRERTAHPIAATMTATAAAASAPIQ
jgi:hypothetical protein